MQIEQPLFFPAPIIEAPEFRLYYDDEGRVLFYTCEKPEGKYVIIDSDTFAQARPDLRVIDGKVSSVNPKAIVCKMKPSTEGNRCATEDISILVDEIYQGSTANWKLTIHEFK